MDALKTFMCFVVPSEKFEVAVMDASVCATFTYGKLALHISWGFMCMSMMELIRAQPYSDYFLLLSVFSLEIIVVTAPSNKSIVDEVRL